MGEIVSKFLCSLVLLLSTKSIFKTWNKIQQPRNNSSTNKESKQKKNQPIVVSRVYKSLVSKEGTVTVD
jgi:hypothetical protein